MISLLNNQNTFTSKEKIISEQFSKNVKLHKAFIKSQENLSSTRFIQNTVTNWVPKAVFARSLADLGDITFLEFFESIIFFFAYPLLGEKIARNKIFSKFLPKENRQELNKNLARSADDLLKDSKLVKSGASKRLLPVKAAIILSCATIPALEYGLSFAKNLFTLKVFKKSNFNNIASLNKSEGETSEQQERVRKSAIKNLKKVGIFSGGSILASLLLAGYGHKSKILQNISRVILQPGLEISKVLKIKSPKVRKALDTYVNTDFNFSNGKFSLGKGQLAITAITGLLGYSAAANDRGKLDKKEVWTRVPVVMLYTIFGSALFDNAFKRILYKQGKYPELIQKDANGNFKDVPALKDLPEIAQKIAKKNNSNYNKELETLIKQKSKIMAVPYGFSLIFMGFLLAGISRIWTQYRYNHSK